MCGDDVEVTVPAFRLDPLAAHVSQICRSVKRCRLSVQCSMSTCTSKHVFRQQCGTVRGWQDKGDQEETQLLKDSEKSSERIRMITAMFIRYSMSDEDHKSSVPAETSTAISHRLL